MFGKLETEKPTPLIPLNGLAGFQKLYVKDESVHPNGTFKDRLSRKALELYPVRTTFGVISYGNTALSLARFIAESNVARHTEYKVIIFLPRGYEEWSFGPSSLGTTITAKELVEELRMIARIIPFDSSTRICRDDDLRALALAAGISDDFINITEGLYVPVYSDIIKEVISQLGQVPDVCIVPFGAGILCNETKDILEQVGHGSVIPISVADPASLARMLYGPLWVDVDELKKNGQALSRHSSPDRTGAIRRPYPVFLIEEGEIRDGIKAAAEWRISAEPSGAAGLGILPRLHKLEPKLDRDKDRVVVFNTGNGIEGFLKNRKRRQHV